MITVMVALLLLFAGVCAIAAAVVFPNRSRHWRSVRWTLLIVPLSALAVTAVVVTAASSAMLLPRPQFQLVAASLVVGALLGLVLALTLSRVLVQDLRQVTATAERIGTGDTSVRTTVRRADELGALADAVDNMAQALAEAEVERETQQESRRVFLAAVSHDLRTPLASMQAAVEALQDGLATDPERYLHSLSVDVSSLGTLIADLFTLTRLETGQWEPTLERVELVELATEVSEAASFHPDHPAVVVTAEQPAWVSADAVAMSRVLRNLIDNAQRHAPQGSEINVEIAVSDGSVEVAVVDQGEGFPPEFLDVAFEHFTRADVARVRGGAGLGLAICRQMVELHRGQIWAERGPGGTVRYTLPLISGPGAGATGTPQRRPQR